MRTAFLIVTYNTRDLLRRCLRSILSECSLMRVGPDVVVVDNASPDGTLDMLREEFPAARVLANEENLGPAKAFNQGLRAILGEHGSRTTVGEAEAVALMNSDIELLPGTIQRMLAFLESNPDVDGVSGALYYPGMAPQRTRDHIVRILPLDKSKPFREDFPGTGFAVIRAAAFLKVGGYDENFYFYNEDLDWAERAKRRGCVFFHLPDAGAIHARGQGRKHNASRIITELYRSNIYYFKRHHPWAARLMRAVFRVDIAMRLWGFRRQALVAARAGDRTAAERARQAVSVYLEAGRRMDREFANPVPPKVPRF